MSALTFRDLNLNSSLLNALDDLGFSTPTPIQQKAFSVVMSGKDVVGIAQTGTGKTLAFLLPSLRQFQFTKKPNPQIIIVVPTRELVLQIVERVKELTTYMSVRTLGIYGGANINTQKEKVFEGVDLLVSTPGRLMDMALSGVLRTKDLKKFIVDEMDEMLSLGFRPQLLNIMDLLPERRQNLLFSATITPEVDYFIDSFFDRPVKVEAAGAGTPLSQINQMGYRVPNFLSKANVLIHLLENKDAFKKVLIFVSSKKFADRLFELLSVAFPEQIGVIHSNKSQNFRINTVQQFDAGETRVLIATDLISRGIDLKEVTHVINVHLPEIPEHYTHRIGRTGRADQKGIALSLVSEKEMSFLQAIETHMEQPLSFGSLPEEIEFTDELTPEEKPVVPGKNYKPPVKKAAESGPAFHEKKEKNQKTNQGGSYRQKIKQKYKKPKTRGQKPRGKNKR